MGEIVIKQMNVTQFLRQYESEETKRSYRIGLKQFFTLIYPDGGDLDELSKSYINEDRDYREDLLSFRESLKNKAPKTKSVRFNVVRTFLDDNGISLPARFFKNLNGKTTEAITYEDVPTNEELKRICEYLPIQGKALTLVLSSGGMRVGEVVQLKMDDIEFDHEPVRVRIRGKIAKTGKRRVAFISPEAKEAVEEWLQFRPQYLKQARGRSFKHKRVGDEGRLFPFTAANFNKIWRIALEKVGLAKKDERTSRIMMRPHNLRKFFRLRVGRFGRDEAEALMGHQKGLNAVYARFEGEAGEARLEEIYVQAIPELSIYEAKSYQLKNELLTKQNDFETTVANLAVENLALKRQLMKIEERLAGYEKDTELIKQKMSEIKFYEEGGITVTYVDEVVKEKMKKYVRELLKERQEQLKEMRGE
jgi:integrase